jgi:fructose-1,6-bisphosphatase/inositol monophosphatase family enzyme
MTTIRIDTDAIGALLRKTAATVIAPRFRALAASEIEEKSPGEVVTIADREAETALTAGLRALAPGVPVIGEEAAETSPALLDAVATAPMAWLVDPLDGTANFARGDAHWATMIALIRAGETVASWIYRHTDDGLYVAELGGGAWRDGRRLTCPAEAMDVGSLRGAVLRRFLTDEERARMVPRFGRFARVSGGFSCTGYEYPAIVEGEEEFALFQRLLPWDHAPGALLLSEAGGVARHPDGAAFRPGELRRGLLLAASPAIWDAVRASLYGERCQD